MEIIFIKAHETGRLSLTFAVDAPDGRMIVSAHYLPTDNVAVGTATIDCVKDSDHGFSATHTMPSRPLKKQWALTLTPAIRFRSLFASVFRLTSTSRCSIV